MTGVGHIGEVQRARAVRVDLEVGDPFARLFRGTALDLATRALRIQLPLLESRFDDVRRDYKPRNDFGNA